MKSNNISQQHESRERNAVERPDESPRMIRSLRVAALPAFICVFALFASFAFADGNAKPILGGIVQVQNDKSEKNSETILTLEHRPTTSMYVVRGRVQYSKVEGEAYLEMWNTMPDGKRYFSRTVENSGPTGKIQGTSDWREFMLPFNLMGTKPESVTLEINVVMPGKGTIELKELTISDIQTTNWFNTTIGTWLAVSVGLYGGLFGCLCGFLVPRGKGRRLVLGMFVFAIFISIVSLLVGISALCFGQPYPVWFPLIFTGGFTLCIFFSTLPAVKKHYDKFELRKMQALDT